MVEYKKCVFPKGNAQGRNEKWRKGDRMCILGEIGEEFKR